MVKRCLIALLLALSLLGGMVSAAASGQPPYAIQVNRACNTVTIYELDANGAYTVPVKAMVCSTARKGYVTPLGTFTLKEFRSPWRLMVDGTYGQYATCFQGNYLFHSVCYEADSHDAMKRESYNLLGEPTSMGCVRLETADAKWIYDHCPAGTPVTIYDDPDNPGPLGKPAPTVEEIPEEGFNGWDPTDPAEGNPWREAEITSIKLSAKQLKLQAGDAARLEAEAEPSTAMILWTSSDPEVVRVDSAGNLTALAAGTAQVTAGGYKGASVTCSVTVTGELLPFTDLQPGVWYYDEVRRAWEADLIDGVTDTAYRPETTLTVAQAIKLAAALHQMEKEKKVTLTNGEEVWYSTYVDYAVANGIVEEGYADDTEWQRDSPVTRAEFVHIFHGTKTSYPSKNNVADGAIPDVKKGDLYADEIYAFYRAGILTGNDAFGTFAPSSSIQRSEVAAILIRMFDTAARQSVTLNG